MRSREKGIIYNNGEFEIENTSLEEMELREKEAQREKNMVEIEKIYEDRNKEADKLLKEAKKETKDSKEGVRDVMKGIDGVSQISFKDRHELEKAQKETMEKLNKLEYDALMIPDNIYDEELSPSRPEVVKKEANSDAKELKTEIEEQLEEFKRKRQEFVDKFIKDSIDEIKGKFHAIFRDSRTGARNGKPAEEMICYKTEKEIRLAAKQFVETGDEADFGFEASMEVSSYNTREHGKDVTKRFITAYVLKVGDHEFQIRAYDTHQGASLVGPRARENMKHSDVKQEKKKIA